MYIILLPCLPWTCVRLCHRAQWADSPVQLQPSGSWVHARPSPWRTQPAWLPSSSASDEPRQQELPSTGGQCGELQCMIMQNSAINTIINSSRPILNYINIMVLKIWWIELIDLRSTVKSVLVITAHSKPCTHINLSTICELPDDHVCACMQGCSQSPALT